MANLCSFSMKIKGSKRENLLTFCEIMEQKGNVWMGRGAEICTDIDKNIEDNEDGTYSLQIEGWCKWSIRAALISDAMSMRTKPEDWSFGSVEYKEMTFFTLFEACKELELQMEAYSEEPGGGFQEHLSYIDEVELVETTPWHEEWNEEKEDWISEGGYEWNFEI